MKKILLNSLAGIVFAFFGMQEMFAQQVINLNWSSNDQFITPVNQNSPIPLVSTWFSLKEDTYLNSIEFTIYNSTGVSFNQNDFEAELKLYINGIELLESDIDFATGEAFFDKRISLLSGFYRIDIVGSIDQIQAINGDAFRIDIEDIEFEDDIQKYHLGFSTGKILWNNLNHHYPELEIYSYNDDTLFISSEDIEEEVYLGIFSINHDDLDNLSASSFSLHASFVDGMNLSSFKDFRVESYDSNEFICEELVMQSDFSAISDCGEIFFDHKEYNTYCRIYATLKEPLMHNSQMNIALYIDEDNLTAEASGGFPDVDYRGIKPTIVYKADLTSINEVNLMEFSMYPNPVNDGQITIKDTEEGSDISIYSIEGKVVLSQKVQSSSEKIDIAHLSPGSYIVRIGEYTQKLMIN